MSNVDLGEPKRAPNISTLTDVYGSVDGWLLKLCAEWQIERARQEENWAKYDIATGWGTLPNDVPHVDDGPLGRSKNIEGFLAESKPQTALLARRLLAVCVDILAEQKRDPDSVLGDGPVLEIVRNVCEALGWLDAETRLGPKSKPPND